MVELVLALLDRLRRPLSALGVDYDAFRAILEVKLHIDTRRRFGGIDQRKGTKPRNFLLLSLVFYAIMGGFVGFALTRSDSLLVSLTIVHGFIMLMVSMALITDFSSVLLDETDNGVLLPRPVSGRTILFARIVHVAIYVGLIALSLSLGTLVIGTLQNGWWFAPAFVLTLVGSVSLCLLGVNVFYLTAMRLTHAERFRDIILYFQMAMAVGVLSSYQLLPRILGTTRLGAVSIEDRWWIYLFPPCWVAAPVDLLSGHVGRPQVVLSAIGVLAPLLSLWLVGRVLAPGFATALARMERAPALPDGEPTRRRRFSLARIWGVLVCRSAEERASFEMIWRLCGRDRHFKLRTYPTAAFVLVLPAVFLSSSGQVLDANLARVVETRAYLILLYLCCSLVPTSIMHLRISDQHRASWIYQSLPLSRPGPVLMAGLKAVFLRLALPAYVLVAGVTLAFWGTRALPDVVLAFLVLLFMSAVQALSFGRSLPFSQPFDVLRSFERVTKSVLLMGLPALLGGIHFMLGFAQWGVVLAIPTTLGAALLLLRAYRRTEWNRLATA